MDFDGKVRTDAIDNTNMNGKDNKAMTPKAEPPAEDRADESEEFTEFLNVLTGEDGPTTKAETNDGQLAQDDGYIGLIGSTTPPEVDDLPVAAAAPTKGADTVPTRSTSETEKAQDNDSEPSAAVEEAKFSPSAVKPQKERRRSSEVRGELMSAKLLNSVNTVDSWGGKDASLAPLPLSGQNYEGEVSDLDDNDLDDDGDAGHTAYPGTGRSKSLPSAGFQKDDDNVANWVDFSKLLQPGSAKYYYSQANHTNRQMLELVKSKKKSSQNSELLDDSIHSKASVLTKRHRKSSYMGPKPLKKDLSVPQSIMKSMSSRSAASVGTASADATTEIIVGDDLSKSSRRCVFSSVDIREHERIAGDNPCVSSGVPLSLGWGHFQHQSILLDDYEENKGPSRDKIEMMVPSDVRKEMLRDEFGVEISDMNAAIREVNITKRHRRHTVASEHLEGCSEVLESAKRKFGRFAKRTSTKKEGEQLWVKAHKYVEGNGFKSLGKNPGSAGGGSINKGPRVGPAKTGEEAPVKEIRIQQNAA